MPASKAHMVIAHQAVKLLQEKGFAELAESAARLDDPAAGTLYRAYLNLGSVGPDLYYYAKAFSIGGNDV